MQMTVSKNGHMTLLCRLLYCCGLELSLQCGKGQAHEYLVFIRPWLGLGFFFFFFNNFSAQTFSILVLVSPNSQFPSLSVPLGGGIFKAPADLLVHISPLFLGSSIVSKARGISRNGHST